MVKSLVTGVFVIAIIQGALMSFIYWLASMGFYFLLTVLSMILAKLQMGDATTNTLSYISSIATGTRAGNRRSKPAPIQIRGATA